MKLRQAKAFLRIGDIQLQLGDMKASAQAYDSARKIIDPIASTVPVNPEARRLLATCCNSEGYYAARSGKNEDAIQSFRREIEIQEELLRDDPKDDLARMALVKHTSNLGALLLEERRFDDARQTLELSLQNFETLQAEKPTKSPVDEKLKAKILHNLGLVFHRREQFDLAKRYWSDALEVSQNLVQAHPFDTESLEALASSTLSLGVSTMDDGRSSDAERYFGRAQFCYAALMAQCPKMPLYRSEHGRASHGLARSLAEQKKLDDAQKGAAKRRATSREAGAGIPASDGLPSGPAQEPDRSCQFAGRCGAARRRAQSRPSSLARSRPKAMPSCRRPRIPACIGRSCAIISATTNGCTGRKEEAVAEFNAAIEIAKTLVVDFPGVDECRLVSAGIRENVGRLLSELGALPTPRPSFAAGSPTATIGPKKDFARTQWKLDHERVWSLVFVANICADRGDNARPRVVVCASGRGRRSARRRIASRRRRLAAWFYAMCPHQSICNSAKAVELAKRTGSRRIQRTPPAI